MSKLQLRIDHHIDSNGGPPPEALATIQTLDAVTGLTLPNTKQLQTRIPISDLESQGLSIDVEAGRYRVEVVLPSGEILSDIVGVDENKQAKVTLRGASSPHEWLGWQNLMGNVTTVKPARRRRATPRPSKSSASGASGGGRKRKAAKRKVAKTARTNRGPRGRSDSAPKPTASQVAFDNFRASPAGAPPKIKVDRPVYWLSQPGSKLLGSGWLTLADLSATPQNTLLELNSGKPPRALNLTVSDSARAVFRVTHDGSTTNFATPLQSNLQRDYIVAESQGALEFLSLPTPWPIVGTGREAAIEIIVQRVPRAREFASSIAVRDERLGLLLAYLSSGALTTAGQIVDGARDMLFMKIENPLAAAAGGYALIGTETNANPKEWHAWINNLTEWFPELPDAAIQLAVLQLRRGPKFSDEACSLFKQACNRGLPYYSLGMRWLLDGLERFGNRDPKAAKMANAVRAVASRMHQQSPFTILRLGQR